MNNIATLPQGALAAQSEEDIIRVLQMLDYNPDTGVFTRKVNSSWAKAGDVCSSTNTQGYIEFNVLGRLVRGHRLAFLIMTGSWPTLTIDHIDGDKKNNRWANLREVDNKTNCENKKSSYKNNNACLLGVRAKNKKWEARISTDGKLHYIGVFDTPELAHAAYIETKKKLHKGYQP